MLSVILWIFFFHRCFHLVSAYSESSYDFYLLEECPLNTLVGIVSLETSTSYRTSASSPEVKDSFFLNHSTGEIRTLKRIDRESIQAFNDTVDLIFVSQTASLISVHVHILDINDNPPVFVQGFNNISIVEGATPGTRFPLQKARDPDKGENGTIAKYLLKPENLGIPNPFKITRVTDPDGEDSLFLELLDSLDREKEASYSFEIQVVDGGSPPLISNSFVFVNILDVNDNAPTFDEGIKNITIRSLGEEGEIVTNISAHDADSGVNSELTFSLLDDVKGQFEIDPSSGIIKRKKKRIICQKDSCGLCLQKLCVLAVEAQDQGSPKLTGRTFLNVHLIDENFFTPQITFKIYPTRSDYVLLDPSFETGTTLVVLTAADGDFGKDGQTEISLISGNEEDFFRLESGQNFAILRLNKIVDKKAPKQFSLEFEASDFGNPPKKSKKTLMIYVKSENDKPPKFEKQNFEITVPEATRPGTRISRIRVRSENGEPELRLLDLDKDLPFSLNPETGVLRVSKNLDFDLRSRYDFEIEASDPVYHWLKSTSKIVVQISDSNNHSPSFLEKRPFISVPENFNIRDPVFRAKCLDLDYAENGAVFYQLTDADLPLVKVDEKKGDVFLLQELDFEKTKNFTFRLSCFDDGIPKKMDSTTVTVFVEDINDNSPFFDSEFLEVNVRQNDPVGTQLATVEAWDLDELDRGLLKYFVIDSPFNDIDVNEETGTLFIKSPMNTHESGSSFKVTVGAKDIGGHFSSNKITVTVHVIDELTEIPVFLEKKRIFKIEENSPVNHLVGNFRATVSHKVWSLQIPD
ncbi:hypothetical protein FO519_009595 [Halicephalobus sp. NKZ332]|nr:hypothetical protein FO519_009595 [Halicephalobus sp. NKZ332]